MSPDTVSDIEPEAVRNAGSRLRAGAGEIGRMKVKPTFKTALDDFGADEPPPLAAQTEGEPEPADRPRRLWPDPTMSALEGGTDEPRKRGHFRF
jgi:hypothetical protein